MISWTYCVVSQEEGLRWAKAYSMMEKQQKRAVHEESRAYTMIKVRE